jgi:hypothetical protein
MNLKFVAYNTSVLLSNGSIKKVQDLSSNDILCGDDNCDVKILKIEDCECENDMCNFIVIPRIGKNFYLYGLHNIPVYFNDIKTLFPVYEFYNFFNKDRNVFLYNHCYNFEHHSNMYMDPYFLGIWLSQYAKQNTEDVVIPTNCIRIYLSHSFIEPYVHKMTVKFNLEYNSTDDYIDILDEKFVSIFNYYNLLDKNNLHIPLVYKTSNPKIRIQLLSALCDMLGNKDEDCFIFDKISNQTFLDDCCFILNSLGFQTSILKGHIKIFSRTIFSIPMVSKKEINIDKMLSFVNNYFQVAPIYEKRYYAIQLTRDSNILLGDFTVV